MTQKRAVFDFAVEFTNGGGIQGQGFRLDIDGDDIDDRLLADCIVRDLRLLMAGPVRILQKEIVEEPHKRIAAGPVPGLRGIVELSHVVGDGTVTYPGLPAPRICDYLSREASRAHYTEGAEFQIARIDMVANTGTYVDCPFHRFADGKDLAQMPADAFAGLEATVIDVDHHGLREIGVDQLRNAELRNRAVLLRTGWDAYWESPAYAGHHPYLASDGAEYLRDCGVALVGIDSMNIDDTRGNARPAHTILLGAGIPIVEHLCNLGALPREGFRFTALPPRFAGVGTFPVRAIAIPG